MEVFKNTASLWIYTMGQNQFKSVRNGAETQVRFPGGC